ncbi:phytochrome A isoform X1 [Elaeis guineensis]|uniref:Phytochrome n=1 Tax=Elaeis guineensis var. tenera TaxID=51953 RepID=A0A6I9QTK9_ELAGV|nr:phytochrome A isoform X1 [Elaeis guineensis]XP_010914829.1 phytochrome A isoform X1 [Elaeis guineensis]
MSSSRPAQSSTSSGRSRHSARIIAQTTVDAKLDAEFEEHGYSFDYSQSVRAHQASAPELQRSEKVTAYLQHIQKGKLIQPFGCLLALDEKTFKVIAYSENAPEILTMVSHAVPSVGDHPTLGVGTDVRTLFTTPSTAALQKALGFAEVSLLNPILVHCKTSGKPFYAIVHRVTACLIVDFEPVKPTEVPMTAAGALQSYKLAAKAISKLQSLPGGSMEKLCNTVVEEVFELTGYDRVMAYKFHEDDHGEVFAEITKPGLEPYLGLHYPATDIPQAARFLFMKSKVRMICDCRAKPVKVHQDEKLPFDITFCGSTLRAPHSCHLLYMENMNSIASLVMAVVVNEGEVDDDAEPGQQQQKRKRLWGLVVCHHESPRFVPFPLRYACEFLMQVFAIHVNKELELENQVREKNILRTQTLLCDMLLREAAPLSIVSQTPNIMDLVSCDGAALLYQNRIWRLGVTPTESQIRDIAYWLSEHHMDSTGLSTDSLHDAGYPGAQALGDIVCGMAAARITSKDILFWFRSHTAAEIRWGGARHDPSDEDDGRRMHPRSSFKAFLEVVKMRSLPWNDYEMDAIHSLQLILRGTLNDTKSGSGNATLDSQLNDLKLEGMVELQAVTNEMVRLIETATVPILAVDVNGLINGWNLKIAQLTGLSVDQAIGRDLLTLVEDCSTDAVKKMLYLALQGKEEQNVQFQMKTHGPRSEDGPVILVVNACASRDINDQVVGVCFVAQDMTGHKMVMDKFTRIEGDYKAIVQNPSPLIPPIFGADEFGWCSEWNAAMIKLSGWQRDEVIDKMLLGEVFGSHMACCRLKNQNAFVNLSVVINNAMTGQETEKTPFSFINRDGKHVECLLSVSKKVDTEDMVTGVFCFLHVASHELQQLLQMQQLSEQTAMKRLKALAYIRHEIRNPLSGIMYSRKTLEGTDLDEEQRQLLSTGAKCHNQLNRILDDLDLENIMDSCLDLEMAEFALHDMVVSAVSQVMIPSQGKGIRIIYDLSEGFMTEGVYGDNLRLQQILADFLLVSVKFSPSGGHVEITASLIKDRLGESLHLIHLELRIIHTGGGVPEELLSQMFGKDDDPSEEGLSLLVCRKLLRLMNGDVRYLREATKSAFIISVELASAPKPKGKSASTT